MLTSQASRLQPKSRDGINEVNHTAKEQMAVELINQGMLKEAEIIYTELILYGTNNYIVYANLAAIRGIQGRDDEIIELLEKTLELEPNNPEALNNLGNAQQQQGDLNAAIASYNKTLELKPNFPDAHFNLGVALQKQGDLKGAINSFNRTFELKPTFPNLQINLIDAYYNLGFSLHKHGDLLGAIKSYKKALELRPNYLDALLNLGVAFQELGDLNAAITSYKKALELNPDFTDVLNNLGVALQEKGELRAAVNSYTKALALNPNYPDANWNYSRIMLLTGNYIVGWRKYEWRAELRNILLQPHAQPKISRWDGKEGNNKHLLIVTEQGLGDTLQFMRYVITLQSMGFIVSFCAQPKLHSLIQASGIHHLPLTPELAHHVTEGHWIPLLSVPLHLNVSSDKPIFTAPYIKTTSELNSKWKAALASEKQPIIGINWQGNMRAEKLGLRRRSLPLEAFAAITTKTNASLLSIQKGFGSEQLKTVPSRIDL